MRQVVQQEQERRRAKASEFDLPVDEPPLPVQEAKPRKGKAPMRPDVFVEESRRAMQTASQKPEQTDPGPDILAERPARGQLDAQVQEQNMEQEQPLPKQLPPLNLDELRRDSMPLVVPNQPREELHAEPEEAEPEPVPSSTSTSAGMRTSRSCRLLFAS